mmetsp:Transcript_19677/g.62675  ORF Transcript_19677/g.62675 Transcript_19677/m.62675 type:complete len:219 (-) Transcript_19677:834-1490(-)
MARGDSPPPFRAHVDPLETVEAAAAGAAGAWELEAEASTASGARASHRASVVWAGRGLVEKAGRAWVASEGAAAFAEGAAARAKGASTCCCAEGAAAVVEEIAEEGVAAAVEGAAEAAAAALVKAEGASPCLATSRLHPAWQRPWGQQPGPAPRRWPASPSGPRRSPRANSTGAVQVRRRESTRRARRCYRRPLCRRRHLAPLSPPRVPPPRRGAAPS